MLLCVSFAAKAQLSPVKKYVLESEYKRGKYILEKHHGYAGKQLTFYYDSTVRFKDGLEVYYKVENFRVKQDTITIETIERSDYKSLNSRSSVVFLLSGLNIGSALWEGDSLIAKWRILCNSDGSLAGYEIMHYDKNPLKKNEKPSWKTNRPMYVYHDALSASFDIDKYGKRMVFVNETRTLVKLLNYNSKGQVDHKWVTKYDERGNEILEQSTEKGKIQKNTSRRYDSKNRLVEEKEINPYTYEEWRYDENDSLVYHLSVYKKDSTLTTITYSEKECRSTRKYRDDITKKPVIREEKTTYNEKHQPVLIVTAQKGNEERLIETIQYTYDERWRETQRNTGRSYSNDQRDTEYINDTKRVIKYYSNNELVEIKFIILEY